MSDAQPLTELQIALLSILWERGETSTADLCQALRPERNLAHTTVATLLSRLERRGVVQHRRRGRHFVYEAIVNRDEVRRSRVAELKESLFGGDAAALMSHLVADHEVDPDELTRIGELIEREALERRGREGA